MFPDDALFAFQAAHDRLDGAGYSREIPRVFAASARQVAELLGPEPAVYGHAASRIAIKTRPRIASLFLQTPWWRADWTLRILRTGSFS